MNGFLYPYGEAILLESEETISNAIDEFNEYRVPEVEAELSKQNSSSMIIKFTGTFCQTCGFYDYFEDFRILLEDDFGLSSRINRIEEIPNGALVEFVIST